MLERVLFKVVTWNILNDELIEQPDAEIVSEKEKNKRKHSTVFSGDRSDGNSDTDESVKRYKPKKKRWGRISDSENENKDDNVDTDLSESDLNEEAMADSSKKDTKCKHDTKKDVNMDKNKKTNKKHDALVERDHDSHCVMTAGLLHWLQNKDKVVLDLDGIHLHDHVLIEYEFLDDKNEITMKKGSISLPEFECKNAKQILYKKQYQNEKEGTSNFKASGQLVEITIEAGKFIKWSDILDFAWDSPELCDAALVSN